MAFARERALLEAQETTIVSERNALRDERRQAGNELNRNLDQLAGRDKEIRNETSSILDTDLVPDIRESLSHVRAREESRTAQ